MIPSQAIAEEKSNQNSRDRVKEIMDGALAACNGDTAKAFYLVSQRADEAVLLLNECDAENKVVTGINARLKEYVGIDDRSWLEKAWDSDATKWVTFGLGVWVGIEVVKAAE